MNTKESNPYTARARKSLHTSGTSASSIHSTSVHRSNISDQSWEYDGSESDSEIDERNYSSRNASWESQKEHSRRSDRSFEGRQSPTYSDLHKELDRIKAQHGITKFLDRDLNSRPVNRKTDPDAGEGSQTFTIVAIVLVVLFIGAGLFYAYPRSGMQQKIKCPQFRQLDEEFSNQDKLLWKSLKVGIENVINQTPPQPSVFLLAYNDAKTSKQIMSRIVNATANCMQSKHPIVLDGSSFVTEAMINDYGLIITTYRKQLESEKIMYVSDVNKIPAQAAPAFHTICDTITPFVEKSVIFLTMHVDQYNADLSPVQVHKLVETQLETNWDAIDHNTLMALIGRVTDQVFLLH